MICCSFLAELKEVFLPRWKRLQSGMFLFFGKSIAGSDLCHRFREQKGWCREIPVPFSHIIRMLVPQIPVPFHEAAGGGNTHDLDTPWSQMSSCKASVEAESEYPETPLFPSHATRDMFGLPWVNGSCLFPLGLPPFLVFVPVPSYPAGMGQVRRSRAFSTAFPCWAGQRAMG